MKKGMKVFLIILFAVIAAIAVLGGIFYFGPYQDSRTSADITNVEPIQKGNLEKVAYVDGQVKSRMLKR